MKNRDEIILEIKEMLVDRLMLPMEADEIDENMEIFEPMDPQAEALPSLELDSVDGLEIMVGISNLYDVKLDPQEQPEAFRNVASLADAVLQDIETKQPSV